MIVCECFFMDLYVKHFNLAQGPKKLGMLAKQFLRATFQLCHMGPTPRTGTVTRPHVQPSKARVVLFIPRKLPLWLKTLRTVQSTKQKNNPNHLYNTIGNIKKKNTREHPQLKWPLLAVLLFQRAGLEGHELSAAG